MDAEEEGPQWDCESVLSLRTNTTNHPGRVKRTDRIKVSDKPEKNPVMEAVEEEDEIVEFPEVTTLRQRGETTEERKARKAAVKEMQKMSRQLKKQTKDTYKEERKKANTRVPAGDIREGVRRQQL